MNSLSHKLSKREREVMLGLSDGLTPQEISDVMRISPKTVAEFRRRVQVKLDARNSWHALAVWVRGEVREPKGDAAALLRHAQALVAPRQ